MARISKKVRAELAAQAAIDAAEQQANIERQAAFEAEHAAAVAATEAHFAASEQDEDEDTDFIPLDQMEAEDEADDADLHRANSVVNNAYKAKYRARAAEMARKPKDVSKKALARSCCDWLAIELARRTLTTDKKPSLVVSAFEAILDANGVKHDHWNRTTPGWQGRLRMTGRLALQRIVAEAGELALPDGSTLPAPKVWIAKHNNA